MMSEKTENKPLNKQDMQYKPLPSESDLKDIKIKIFLAAQKAKHKFKIRK